MFAEDQSRSSHWNSNSAKTANSTILLTNQRNVDNNTGCHSQPHKQPCNAQSTHADISYQWEDHLSGMSCIRQALINSGLEVDTTNIIMASWRDNKKAKYSAYINQWLNFCERNCVNYLQATANDGLKYLTQVFNDGRQYSTVNAARSALSAILPAQGGIPFGKLPAVTKFVKGVANLRPPLPKYTKVWHVSMVLNKFRSMEDNDALSLKDLTLKLTTLLCLVL